MTAILPPDPGAELRRLPRADHLLEAAARAGHVARLGHAPVMEAVRATLETARGQVLSGATCPAAEALVAALLARLTAASRPSLRRVLNATGVVLHTNLGRAPLSRATAEAMAAAAQGYSNLEFDLDGGERGDRSSHVAVPLARLTGAADALAVNNGAAAVLLGLAALCTARPSGEAGADGPPEVIVGRGQLVEIGGGFRIPDVLRRSGATLVEVGTTNRTYLRDFEEAVTPRTRALLSVHRSNFRIDGFVTEPTLAELSALARRRDLWLVDDLGSGSLLPTAPHGLGAEPTVGERVRAGPDLVTFSGDKLLGGPQAGLLVGGAAAIGLCRRHPLLRALRLDKVTLAGLAATLAHYERGEAVAELPVWRAIARTVDELVAEAEAWLAAVSPLLPAARVRPGASTIGGGTLPGETLPTALLALPVSDPDRLVARLRAADTPVVARIEDGAVVLDPRTVEPAERAWLLAALRAALATG